MERRTLHRPASRTLTALLALAVLSPACANRPAETGDSGLAPAQAPERARPTQTEDQAAPAGRAVAIGRALHEAAMTEVVLDPRGIAALSLDAEGGLRLWTDVRAPESTKVPIALPVQEPVWMSLAQDAEGAFIVATIDTAGAGRVARVQPREDGARFDPLFEIAPTDPLFELHVLDGGTRVLALGIDHQLSLYDTSGAVVSVLDEPGFVPWQLRLAPTPAPGAPPVLVAVLAGPTRVQRISLVDDRLALAGQAHEVALDRGPNRNDLALSPDGSTVAALRRPRGRGHRFTLELITLATGERRLLAADIDRRVRPRLHLVDGERALLESGSGQGFWVELSAAVPWTQGTSREETEDVPAATTRVVSLPASIVEQRAHATLVAGLRAVPTADALVIDPIDSDAHWRHGVERITPRAAALDADGGRAAWSTPTGLVIDAIDGSAPAVVPGPESAAIELAFIGRDRLLALSAEGEVTLHATDDGRVLDRKTIDVGWGLSAAGFRRGDAEGRGTLALLVDRPRDPVHVLDVDGGLGAVRDVPHTERPQWPELGMKRRAVASVVESLGLTGLPTEEISIEQIVTGAQQHLVTTEGRHPRLYRIAGAKTDEVELRTGVVTRVLPDPTDARLVVVQRVRQSTVFEDFVRDTRFDEYAISLYDAAGLQRQWTRPVTGLTDVDWSGDGTRLAVAGHGGGDVIDAASGSVVLSRRHLGLRVVEHADDSKLDGKP